MRLLIILLVSILLISFITNIIFEYIHIFNLKKHKNKKNTNNKRPLQFFLHFHILKEITFCVIINICVKIKIITFLIYRYATFSKSAYANTSISEDNNEQFMNKEHCEIKTIYFVRHSESVWNNTFNKKVTINTIFSALFLILYELIFLFSKRTVTVDAPLSNNGIIQSLELSNFLQEKKSYSENRQNDGNIDQVETSYNNIKKYGKNHEMKEMQPHSNNKTEHLIKNSNVECNIKINGFINATKFNNENNIYNHKEIMNLSIKEHIEVLNGLKYKSVLLCSNLRRAISTCFIAFYNRIGKFNESVYALNSLQELSPNPDCVPLVKFHKKYIITDTERFLHNDVKKFYEKNLLVENIFYQNCFYDTLNYIFNNENSVFIVVGHSIWFLCFVNHFIKSQHKAKTQKVPNTGVVVFNIIKYSQGGKVKYEIENNHIRSIYKRFI